MKIGIGFFGIPRNSERTFPSIEKYILQPASQLGDIVPLFHLYQQSHVINERSNENSALSPQQYQPFIAFQGALEDPGGIAESYGFEQIYARGDAWGDSGRSLRNLLLQLHSLNNVTEQMKTYSPDVVVFVRPDLYYHQSFESGIRAMFERNSGRVIRLPFWQWAGGYNDRFAICGKSAFKFYGKRIEQIQNYLRNYPSRPLHAERLLRFSLDTNRVMVRRLDVMATRVRANGIEVDEDFSRVQANRLIRWGIRELGKKCLDLAK